MSGNGELQQTKSKQDVKIKEIKVEATKVLENGGMPPVINKDLEKFANTTTKQKVPLFKEEKKTISEIMGDSVNDYEKLLVKDKDEKKAVDVTYKEFDNMTIKDILAYFESDGHVRHKDFAEMEESFKILVNFGENYKNAMKAKKTPLDFNDCMRLAESTAKVYQVSHKKWAYGHDYGKNRYKVSCRILDIIKGLRSFSADAVSARIKEVDTKIKNSQIDVILDEQSFSDKEKGKVIGDWLENGKEYKAVIKKLLQDEKILESDKLTLARVVADKNRRLVANKVTLSMVCDENRDITLGLADLRKKLDKYLNEKFNASDDNKKFLFDDVTGFRAQLSKFISDYKKENKDLIERTSKRKEKFIAETGIDGNDSRFWEKEDVNRLLIDSEDNTFLVKLNSLKSRSNDNIAIADQLIDDLGYSKICADSIKNKVRKELSTSLIFGGEVHVAQVVKDIIKRLRYVAADEFEAESRVSHLMKVLQIPDCDKDVFTKYVSGDGTIDGILRQKTSQLRKKADTYYENLKGVREAEKISLNKKLVLKKETWQKIEDLKNNMGTMDKKAFKKELEKILKENNGTIDLTKTNITHKAFIKSKSTDRVRQDIGFSARILGDLFLKDKEITGILTKEEIDYFRENLLQNLSKGGGKDIGDLEFLPTGAIKSVAIMLKKNLVNNKDFIKELRKENKDKQTITNEVLMRMTVSTELLSLGDLNNIVSQVEEKHAYDNKVEDEKEKLKKALIAGGGSDATVSKERYIKFIKQYDFLKTTKMGKYALFAQHLMNKNEVFTAMMNYDEKTFGRYLTEVVDKKMGHYIDAVNASKMQKAFKEIYVDSRFDILYNGQLEGGISHVKEDMAREQQKYFDKYKFKEKDIDKAIQKATEKAVKDIVGKDKKKVKQIGAVYACAEAVISDCYSDKNKINILSSTATLNNEIKKAYNRYDENRAAVEKKLKELGDDEGSVFYGYGTTGKQITKDGTFTAATFMKTLSKKMMLTDKKDLLGELPNLLADYEKVYRKQQSDLEPKKISATEQEKGKEVIAKKVDRQIIRRDRDKLIGFDNVSKDLETIFKNKALVTVGTGKATSLSHDNWQKARDYINKEIRKYYDLDAFATDLLVEKNVNALFDDEIDRQGKWLYHASAVLGAADENEEKISQDEQRLLLVNAYRHLPDFEDKSRKGDYLFDRKTLKGQWYKDFRKNYKELKKLEDLKITFPPLEQERLNITRSLRALLATGIGIKEQDSKAKESFESKAKKAFAYIDYVNKFMKCADEALNSDADYKKEKDVYKSMYLTSLRQYYHDRIIQEVTKPEGTVFDETAWKAELSEFAKDKVKVKYIAQEAITESVSNKTFNKKNRNFSEIIGRDSIEKLIKEKGSRGCERKYNKLSEEEKELFSLGLMLMEKGAIGFDAGSVSVLANESLKDNEISPRLKELTKYMAGQDYDFKIDYSVGYYKLTNVGMDFFNDEKEAFSKSAFEKAWEFAKAITGKMKKKDESVTKEDKVRMGDGISSIYEAALLEKKKAKQLDEVDNLRKTQVTADTVKEKLLEYAELDSKTLKEYEKAINRKIPNTNIYLTNKVVTDVVMKDIDEEIELRKKCVKRLDKMDKIDMYRLIAVLQNRAALDTSSQDSKKHIDDDKREELKLLFSEDNLDKAMEKFSGTGACMQALISALSFKIKDDKTHKGSRLSKKDFDSQSFKRKSLVDWRILDKAFEFLDELDKDKLTRYALMSAPNYIEATGNQKAIDAYREHVKDKDPSTINADKLESFLRKEADKDRISKDNKDAKLALAGYEKLTPQQKKLFIKVLGRRDFLDISKKNLYYNITSESKERNYANETGRFRLIDEYIDKSLGGNEGIVLSETAYADAFKSLLSTQVDDTADFKNAKKIEDVLANEKYYIFKRDTAVDWKLFTRALQFVTRANYELEIREGNDELYRSAGDITRYGHLSMDYSVLRKNIHNTGNQLFRFGVQKGKKLVSEESLGNFKIFNGMSIYEIKDGAKSALQVVAPGLAKSIDKLDEMLKVEEKPREKRISDLPEFMTKDIKEYDVKGMITKQLVGKIYTSEDSLTNEINELVVGALSNGVDVAKIGELIKKKLDEKPTAGKEKRLDGIIGDFKVEHQYGNIRDEIDTITAKYKEINELPEKYKNEISKKLHLDTAEKILNLSVASNIKEAIENQYAEATTYVLSKVDAAKGEIVGELEDNPFVKEVTKSVNEILEKYKKANESIDELMKKPQEIVDLIQNKSKEVAGTIIEGAIGKEGVEFVKETTNLLTGFGTSLMDKVSWMIDKVNKYKVYIDGFRDIALSIKNKHLLGKAEDKANSIETYNKDKETLESAKKVQSARQQKLNKNVVEEHRDLQKLSKETANTIQNMAIAQDVIDMSLALGQEIFGKLDAGVATGLVKSAVEAGIQFATYCIRCMKDKSMLRTYYTETEKGQETVNNIKNGYIKLAGSKSVMDAELMNRDTLDIVATGNGYEKTDELVRDTGLKMATSIAFCASNYNPIRETKVMATTVMLVLGLKDKIGKTDAATIGTIVDKMKAS